MNTYELWVALAGGIIGGVLGCVATLLSTYWGPRKLEDLREKQAEERIYGPRKHLLKKLLEDNRFEWRRLSTVARATGTIEKECRRLLIEIGARGSLSEGEELWALLSRKPTIEQ
jgi:acyl-CoA synthetase (AMP-forming)/AMP-acid ligase II